MGRAEISEEKSVGTSGSATSDSQVQESTSNTSISSGSRAVKLRSQVLAQCRPVTVTSHDSLKSVRKGVHGLDEFLNNASMHLEVVNQ